MKTPIGANQPGLRSCAKLAFSLATPLQRRKIMRPIALIGLAIAFLAIASQNAQATTKGLSQIVTPELQAPGDLSLSFQAQSEFIGNPYELQAEMGLTDRAEFAVFRGLKPDDWIFGT